MMEISDGKLTIDLGHISPNLKIEFKDKDERFQISDDFELNNEAKYQFTEGVYYAYSFFEQIGENRIKSLWKIDTDGPLKGIFKPFSKTDSSEGLFAPNTFVGTLVVPLIMEQQQADFAIEVHSSKIDYHDKNLKNKLGEFRSEYQLMLEDIAEYSSELVMQYNVPIQQSYETGLEQLDDEKQLYQRFLFVRSLFKNQEFEESVQKIISNPATKWMTELEDKDVRSIRRFSSKNIRELASRPNRTSFHGIINGLNDVPLKISSKKKVESLDTPENRFVKHILESYLKFCETIEVKLEKGNMLREMNEVRGISQRLDNLLNQPFFKEVSRPTSLKINSPILQRRSGYREILRSWLRFHLTAQLSWHFDENDDNLFTGGKKDIASLYEYWVFFVLFNSLHSKYGQLTNKDPQKWIEGLIVQDQFGLGLMLQEGKTRAFEFKFKDSKRPLNICFYYNRSFVGGRIYEKKRAGSYSKAFRPDYTLSIWPDGKTQYEAEASESIVHIHFDAKYKVEYSFIKEEKSHDIENEEEFASAIVTARDKEEKEGRFKNVDLYKMHAYKDAIRRSGGAYILYPGNADPETKYLGFHEIIPGVGAFALRPNNETDASSRISAFIDEVIKNLDDVLSQREQMALTSKYIYSSPPAPIVDHKLDDLCRSLAIKDENPANINVLVGYYKSTKHLEWIEKNLVYNIRYGGNHVVDGQLLSSRFLVLYGGGSFQQTHIFEIDVNKGRLLNQTDLLQIKPIKYPSTPRSNQYFVFKLKEKIFLENFAFDQTDSIITEKVKELISSYHPVSISLLELAKIRK
jgi:predicted component of viral defense system (DUF524 family)